jgi:hypothetical protein
MPLPISRPQSSVQICTDASAVAALEQARRALQRATTVSDGRQSAARAQARTEVERLETAIRDATIAITLRGLPKVEFQQIIAAHPPVKGEPVDEQFHVNVDTVVPDLVAACFVEARWIETGELADLNVTDLPEFIEQLTDGQYTAVLLEVLGVNRGNPLAPPRGTTSPTPAISPTDLT